MKKSILSTVTIFTIIFVTLPLIGHPYIEKGYQYLYPLPHSKYVPLASTLIIRFENITPDDLTNLHSFIHVEGEKSGIHRGETTIASDHKTVIFYPNIDFWPEETVNIRLTPEHSISNQEAIQPLTYQFQVVADMEPDQIDPIEEPPQQVQSTNKVAAGQARIMPNGVSVPSDFPHVNVTVNNNPAPGYIFIDNRGGRGNPWNVIFDNTGSPIWYMKTPDGERRDFKVQDNGWITMMIRSGYGGGNEGFIALDENYNHAHTYRAFSGSKGYWTDEHELQVLADGGYLLIARRRIYNVKMSDYILGDNRSMTVRETAIQEFTANDEKVLEWPALAYFDIADLEDETLNDPGLIRFPHMNAIDIDTDGNILLSSRYLSEITKIDRQTGDIIWRFGGGLTHRNFTFKNDDLNGFRGQHDIRVVGPNRYTLYDNGNWRTPSEISRAVEYELDTNKMEATLKWEYRENYSYYAHYMGNAQRLPNGNTLINWVEGQFPKAMEVRQDKSIAFELNWADGYECYRTHRCEWEGVADEPLLIVESSSADVTLIFNKFGDTNVDYYNIYAGTSSNPTALLDTSRLTLKRFTNTDLENGFYHFRVRAVSNGSASGNYSDDVGTWVNLISPGGNMVSNGDFSDGKTDWILDINAPASGGWDVEDGVAHIEINNGGDGVWQVQFKQSNLPLVLGEEYLFEFDAWADAVRSGEIKVEQEIDPWINYSQQDPTYLSTSPTTYSHSFIMQSPTDYNARIVFNIGANDADVYVDNVSLTKLAPTDNMVVNGNFSNNKAGWTWELQNAGDAEWLIEDGVCHYDISNGGDNIYDVQLRQNGMDLIQGKYYLFEFDAWADANRSIEAKVGQDNDPWTNYSGIGWTDITTSDEHYQYTFQMQDPTDNNGRVVINTGTSNADVYVDNISLKEVIPSEIKEAASELPLQYVLSGNYPNPFNAETMIAFSLPRESRVKMVVYNILGKFEKELCNCVYESGSHEIRFNGSNMGTGLYFCLMEAITEKGNDLHRDVHKILLIK